MTMQYHKSNSVVISCDSCCSRCGIFIEENQPLTADVRINQLNVFFLHIIIKDHSSSLFHLAGEGYINSSLPGHNRVWRTWTPLTSHRSFIILTGLEEKFMTSVLEA